MNRNLKILLVIILITSGLTQKRVCRHLGFGQNQHHSSSVTTETDIVQNISPQTDSSGDYFVSDSVYEWSELDADWVTVDYSEEAPIPVFASSLTVDFDAKPIDIDWNLLTSIKYKLKYFKEIEAEMYAPVFTEALKSLDGKEVTIKGYVMPIDVEGDLKALSANPYASCFFCGKASPASVMSLYLKKDKTYKLDAFKKFRGKLRLNYNDPNEFYYILENAVAVK